MDGLVTAGRKSGITQQGIFIDTVTINIVDPVPGIPDVLKGLAQRNIIIKGLFKKRLFAGMTTSTMQQKLSAEALV